MSRHCILVLVALLPCSLVAQGRVMNDGVRRSTRVLYTMAEKPAEIYLHYGAATWREEHGAEVGKKSDAHFRLGTGYWATLHNNTEMELGGKKVPANIWHLGLHRSKDAKWSLTLMDAAKVARVGRISGSTRDVKPDLLVPLQFGEAKLVQEKLRVAFELDREAYGKGRLTLRWGSYEMHAPYDVKATERVPEGEPKFAKLDPKRTVTTKSGLQFQELKPGVGAPPKAGSEVEVRYVGWSEDGKRFDSSFLRGSTATFPVDRLIKGWTEGLKRMKPGAVFLMRIPPDLAYGAAGAGPIGPNATLTFWVELVRVR